MEEDSVTSEAKRRRLDDDDAASSAADGEAGQNLPSISTEIITIAETVSATNELQELLIEWSQHFSSTRSFREDDSRLKTIQDLCDSGADLELIDERGTTPCIPSVFWSRKLVQFFLDRGRDVNAQNEFGDTALSLAIRHGLYWAPRHMVRFLLQKSANPNVPNHRGENTFFTFVRHVKTENVKHVLAIANSLIDDYGLDLTTRNIAGQTILHYIHLFKVSEDPLFQLAKLLIQRYPGNIDEPCMHGRTPLMYAVARSSSSSNNLRMRHLGQMLIDMGADIEARDLGGYTLLHHAVTTRQAEIVQLFVSLNPKSESLSGRSVEELECLCKATDYDTSDEHIEQFTSRKLLELIGALSFLHWDMLDMHVLLGAWRKALTLSIEQGRPTETLQANLRTAEQSEATGRVDELVPVAIATVIRVSSGSRKVWNLMIAICKVNTSAILDHVSEQMALSPDEDYGSLEGIDLYALQMVTVRIKWTLVNGRNAWNPDNRIKFIEHVHSVAKLAVQCLRKWVEVTGQSVIPDSNLFNRAYIKICYCLGWIKANNPALEANDSLIKQFIELDPRDVNGHGIMHFAALHLNTDYLWNVVKPFFECGADVSSTNNEGLNAYQLIELNEREDTEKILDILLQLAGQKGVHFDAVNSCGESVADVNPEPFFQFETLQCLCARVLARNDGAYKGRDVPKSIRTFINMHVYQ